jgi:hypothetical protein
MPTIPASFPPRQETTHQVNYIRKVVNFSDPGLSTGVCFAAIPLGSYILKSEAEIVTAFNAGTTNPLSLGTTTAANELLQSGDITAATPAVYTNTRGNGRSLTQTATAAVSGVVVAEGGIGLFVKYAPTGTAATTGQAVLVVQYIPNNDG